MGGNLDLVKGAVIIAGGMVSALCNGAFDALVVGAGAMVVHDTLRSVIINGCIRLLYYASTERTYSLNVFFYDIRQKKHTGTLRYISERIGAGRASFTDIRTANGKAAHLAAGHCSV